MWLEAKKYLFDIRSAADRLAAFLAGKTFAIWEPYSWLDGQAARRSTGRDVARIRATASWVHAALRTTGWPGRNYRLNPSDEMQLSLPAKEHTSVMTSGIWGSYRFAM